MLVGRIYTDVMVSGKLALRYPPWWIRQSFRSITRYNRNNILEAQLKEHSILHVPAGPDARLAVIRMFHVVVIEKNEFLPL